MKVKCPNCGRMDFDTTDKYNPDVTPNGSMVKSNLTYHIDWLCSSTTLASEMTCPECLAQLAPSGRLLVVPSKSVDRRLEAQIPRIDVDVEDLADVTPKVGTVAFVCDECGKQTKTKAALIGHMRSHKK